MVIHTVDSHINFGIVNKAEIDVFLELSCFFDNPTDVDNSISGSSASSKSSLNIWKFLVHVLLKLGLENFEYYFASMWNKCNCMVVWTLFSIALLWDWMKTDVFQSCGHSEFSKSADIFECSTLTASSFRILNSSAGILSPPLALFLVTLPKTHLASHSRISSSQWMTTPSWLSGSLRTLL